MQTQGNYASGSTPSHVIRLFREGDALLRSPQLLMTARTYYSCALGEATALPNSYFTVNTRIPLSNCQNAQGQDIQQLNISRISGLISWQKDRNSSLTETCSVPSPRSTSHTTNVTRDRVLSVALGTSGISSPSSYTCSGDSGPTRWEHGIDINGLLTTTTTRPGGNPTTVSWAGGNSWFTQADAYYTERYASTPTNSQVVEASVTLLHPAVVVGPACFSQPVFRLNNGTIEFISTP